MLGIVITLLLIVHIAVCFLMSVIVLMQRPRKDGLGAAFGGGMTDTMFGAQTTNVLQKATVFLATSFFVITLVLALLFAKQQRQLSARDSAPFLGDEPAENGGTAAEPADATSGGSGTEDVPTSPSGEGETAPGGSDEDVPETGNDEVEAPGEEGAGETPEEDVPAGDPVEDPGGEEDAGNETAPGVGSVDEEDGAVAGDQGETTSP